MHAGLLRGLPLERPAYSRPVIIVVARQNDCEYRTLAQIASNGNCSLNLFHMFFNDA